MLHRLREVIRWKPIERCYYTECPLQPREICVLPAPRQDNSRKTSVLFVSARAKPSKELTQCIEQRLTLDPGIPIHVCSVPMFDVSRFYPTKS
jgi:hypothetical protein